MKTLGLVGGLLFSVSVLDALPAQVPQLLNYQGRVVIGGTNYDGPGQFKFAFVNGNGSETFWSNDGSSTAGKAPTQAVSLTVTKGLYAVLLGDTTLAHMTAIPSAVFTNGDVRLRLWFDDGVHGSQWLAPDQRVAAVGYAMMADSAGQADTVKDGAITGAQIAPGAVGATQIAAGAVGSTQLAKGAVGSPQLADGAVTPAQLAPGSAVANLNAGGQSGVASGGLVLGHANNAAAMVQAGYASLGPIYIGDSWLPTSSAGAPSARRAHRAVWTGKEVIVWGGYNGSVSVNDGARYDPVANRWRPMTTVNAPSPRSSFLAVWTGTEMIVYSDGTGGRYNPVTDQWTTIATAGAPVGWYYGAAVWSGTEMLVWGGQSGANPPVNTGARYNPATDTWTSMTTVGALSARDYHSMVWTGTEMIVWGGYYTPAELADGARYNPVTDIWAPTATAGAPSARHLHSGVWTGTEMVIWGGTDSSNHPTTGARYNPVTDTWQAMAMAGAPPGRFWHWPVAAWTGTEVMVWGGMLVTGAVEGTGGRYNPSTDNWLPLTLSGAPSARGQHSAVWTDAGYFVFGGIDSGGYHLGLAASYLPGRLVYLYQRP